MEVRTAFDNTVAIHHINNIDFTLAGAVGLQISNPLIYLLSAGIPSSAKMNGN